jgi:hypothetical protein
MMNEAAEIEVINWDMLDIDVVENLINNSSYDPELEMIIRAIEAENNETQEKETSIATIKDTIQLECQNVGLLQESIISGHRLKLGCFLYNELTHAQELGMDTLKETILIYKNLLQEKTLHLEFLLNHYTQNKQV